MKFLQQRMSWLFVILSVLPAMANQYCCDAYILISLTFPTITAKDIDINFLFSQSDSSMTYLFTSVC
jgi:cellulose synthase/poly-beta-1,6-N-acetylglucosamine synthase-like glycosyltransferase